MKIKFTDLSAENYTLPPNYSFSSSDKDLHSLDVIKLDKKSKRYLLGNIEKSLSFKDRIWIGIKIFCKTFFSLGLIPLKSEKCREEFKSFFAGKKIKAVYTQNTRFSQLNHGTRFVLGKERAQFDKEVVKLYQLAANQGFARAQCNLGAMYELGRGVVQSDEKAIEYYQLASNQGYVHAQFNLGCMYSSLIKRELFNDLDHDELIANQKYEEESTKYFQLAANQGHAQSQLILGFMYSKNVDQHKEAVKYFELAADQGHANAQFHLGRMHEEGKGTAQSNEKAKKYYQLAANQGSFLGQQALNSMSNSKRKNLFAEIVE